MSRILQVIGRIEKNSIRHKRAERDRDYKPGKKKKHTTLYDLLKAAKYEIQKPSNCFVVSFRRCFPFFTLRDHSHVIARTLTCFAIFPTDFRGKERLLAVYSAWAPRVFCLLACWPFRSFTIACRYLRSTSFPLLPPMGKYWVSVSIPLTGSV